MRALLVGILLGLLIVSQLATAQTIPIGGGGSGNFGSTTVTAGSFTTTGTATYVGGYTMGGDKQIGTASGGYMQTGVQAGGQLVYFGYNAGVNVTNTSSATSILKTDVGFAPASGTGSYAAIQLNPTINGISTGTAYGVGIAMKTNTLSGGTIKALSIGTTTGDLFTGYTENFAVATTGQVNIATTAVFNASATLANAPANFKDLNLILTANGQQAYCGNCNIANPCTGGGTGAIAKRLNGVMVCN